MSGLLNSHEHVLTRKFLFSKMKTVKSATDLLKDFRWPKHFEGNFHEGEVVVMPSVLIFGQSVSGYRGDPVWDNSKISGAESNLRNSSKMFIARRPTLESETTFGTVLLDVSSRELEFLERLPRGT